MRRVYMRAWLSEMCEAIRLKASAIQMRDWIGSLHKAAYRRFPKFVSDPDFERRLAVYRSRDNEENERSLPPDGESIQLLCFWATEYYLPSHIDGLMASFEKLGWDEEDDATATNSPVRWLQRRRQTLSGGGWMNLGRIDRPGSKTTIPGSRTAPLPDDVAFAFGHLYSITSTISCVVIAFVLKDEASLRYDEALRRNYETELRPVKRGHAIIGPERQKLSAIRDIRNALRTDLAAWYRSNLPGFFSAENIGAGLPTCEFQTLAKGAPFPPRKDGSPGPDGFLTALDIDNDADAWEYEDVPGLKFAWPLMHDRSQKNHAIIAANEGDFSDEAIRYYGGRSGSSLSSFVDDHINVLLGRWTLLGVLAKLQKQFSAIRESAHVLNRSNKDALRALK